MRHLRTGIRRFLPLTVSLSLFLNVLFVVVVFDYNRKWSYTQFSQEVAAPEEKFPYLQEMVWPSTIGSFRVLTVPSGSQFSSGEFVTFTTHATPEFLDHMVELGRRWQGPISVAVYSPGTDVLLGLRIIHYLRQCSLPLVSNLVSFHLFSEEDQSTDTYTTSFSKESLQINCSLNFKQHFPSPVQTYRQQHNKTYPVNAARNIARVLASTHYILTSDIELYPSANFIPSFIAMVRRNKGNGTRPVVYVLPVFEVDKSVAAPLTKAELVDLLNKKKAVTFHQHVCVQCHKIPEEKRWIEKVRNDSMMDVFLVAKRRPSWEPIFVGTNRDPLYDERLSWEGMSDKMSQMYEMCLMNYELHILDNAFLVHSPGIKKDWKKNLNWRKPFMRDRYRILRQIKLEINARHSENKNCTL